MLQWRFICPKSAHSQTNAPLSLPFSFRCALPPIDVIHTLLVNPVVFKSYEALVNKYYLYVTLTYYV